MLSFIIIFAAGLLVGLLAYHVSTAHTRALIDKLATAAMAGTEEAKTLILDELKKL
jgi:hypothetical protein